MTARGETPPSSLYDAGGQSRPALYTIPAGLDFAGHFAATLLQQNADNPEKLTEILVLLPTRRACRIVREAFLRQSGGTALLLPRMQTLGDVDEDSLGLEMTALGDAATSKSALDIPAPMPPLRRRMILTRLVMAQHPHYTDNPDQALALADALGGLMDKIHTEGLSMAALPQLVDGTSFAEHWQITLSFLTILSEIWPSILDSHAMIDATDRRDRLLRLLAQHWTEHPPAHPVIAAGSTGSIPATRALLRVVAHLPQGCVILPGLDRDMDDRGWGAIDDTHPQATLKILLQHMGSNADLPFPRQDVALWPGIAGESAARVENRTILAREIMRPAATTEQWRDLGVDADRDHAGADTAAKIAAALKGIERIDCATPQEEARLISLLFRYVQHTPGKQAVLVTSDRTLARRVASCCARWGLQVDDTAGVPLAATRIGAFLRLCVEAVAEDLAPVSLLALLKHTHAAGGMEYGTFRHLVRRADMVLRGPRPGPGMAGLREHMGRAPDLEPLVGALESCMAPLLGLADGKPHPFRQILDAHLQTAEALATGTDANGTPRPGAARLWMGDEGESAASFLSTLRDQVQAGDDIGLPDMRLDQYCAVLDVLMRGISVRPSYGAHPRLMIMGPLEARLLQADLVILAGLNEGTWPPAPDADPWMSRPMRAQFGLPSPDRGIGLSAHDFVQGFCAPEIVLTRAARAGTSPTIPSRWLQRLDTVLEASGLSMARTDWLTQIHTLDLPAHTDPSDPAASVRISRPAPRPPVAVRPRSLSVTAIETWMRDPYAVYARYILGLKKLKAVDEQPGAAERGNILHDTLERFVKAYTDTLPDGAYDTLAEMIHTDLYDQVKDPATRHFWGVRFDRAAQSFIAHEQDWRVHASPVATEIKGALSLPGLDFTLTGKIDRIDRMRDGSGLVVIDYKTGGHGSTKDVLAGFSPQLPLEAAMIREGAFGDQIPDEPPHAMEYWKLSGGQSDSSKIATRVNKENKKGNAPASTPRTDCEGMVDQALMGLEQLVRIFDQEDTPYLSLPRPDKRPRFQDYAHLARVQEWAVLDDPDEGGEAA